MSDPSESPVPEVRKGQGDVKLSREEFTRRLGERFYDPTFDSVRPEIDRIIEVAWKNYDEYHKSPRKRKAGPGFADPDFELPVEWLEARQAILAAQQRHSDPSAPSRILLVCGAARHDQTCPGEMSKTFRLVQLAREIVIADGGFECDLLDLSHAHGPVRPADPSLQGLRVDGHAALPLALLLLSEPRHGPGQRLDERDLSALGRGARRSDRDAGLLVPGPARAQADDGPAGLRRRRQSRSDHHSRKEAGGSQSASS